MGKKPGRCEVAPLPAKVDHAVFGNLLIAQQSPLDTARYNRHLLPSPGHFGDPRASPPRRARSQHDLAATRTNNNGELDARPTGNTREGLVADPRDLRRSYSHESATAAPVTKHHRYSPPLRRNPNYGRRSPSSSSASSSLRSSSITDDDVFPPSPPSISRGSSIEEEDVGDGRSSVASTDADAEHDKAGRRRVSFLVDELLYDIYEKDGDGDEVDTARRRRNSNSSAHESDGCSSSVASCRYARLRGVAAPFSVAVQRARLDHKGVEELGTVLRALRYHVQFVGALLVKELKRREALISKRDKQYDVVTAFLQAHSEKRSEDTRMRFSAMPPPGDSGFTQWHDAMKMVARLSGGIPSEFRRRLWLTLAEKHLQSRGVDWSHAERFCFNEWMNPDDDELGIQIVKDLHRTGCSLFCGVAAQQNQALLKRVLLAFARWNKGVGYCQGFNMLAAIILQVCDRSDTDALKVMIYLIEGVLPESYFANNLRGLSVDMAVFRDLLRLRLPSLSRHLEQLQHDARDTVTGTSYEPPLTNVFTMQWFLTLFSNCLPQSTVLRVWDLIFLEGNEVLLRTALAIWDTLADRIMAVDSADEFYSIMGVLTREMLEFGLMDTNNLIKAVVQLSLPELPDLRDKYLYNITPWSHTVSNAARRGLRLFHSDDEEETDEDDEKMAVAAAYGLFRSPRQRDSAHRDSISSFPFAPDRERLALDISALKQQYSKLRERQRQAHIILTAACARQPLSNPSTGQVAMNHLLLGKSALMSVRGRRGAPPGAVPPPAIKGPKGRKEVKLPPTKQSKLVVPSAEATTSSPKPAGETLHWKDASLARKRLRRLSLAGESIVAAPSPPDVTTTPVAEEEATLPPDDTQDVNDDDDGSSTSTELCDEPDRLSDFDSEEQTSEASSYNLAGAATDEKASASCGGVTAISPVYEEEGPSKDASSPVSELGSSFDLKVAVGGEKSNKSLSPSSGETSSYNLASSKTTSYSQSLAETASRQVDDDGVDRRDALARNATDTSLSRLDDDDGDVMGVECRDALTRNATETSLMRLDDDNLDDAGIEISVAPPLRPDTASEKVKVTNETHEINLMQIEDDVEEDLDESFENFVVERRKSTATPIELEPKEEGTKAKELTKEDMDAMVPENEPVILETVKPDHDILRELVSQLSLDLKTVSVPSPSQKVVEPDSELPRFVCELVEDTTFHSSLEVLVTDGETPVKSDLTLEEGIQAVVSSDGGLVEMEDNRREEDKTEICVSCEIETPHDETQVNYPQKTMKKESDDDDAAKTSAVEYLDVSPKFNNVGRRHSERAMQIIHENNLILQNISQLQARRPSDLSGGDVTKRRSVIGVLGLGGDEIPEDVARDVTSETESPELETMKRPADVASDGDPISRTIGDLSEVELDLKTSHDRLENLSCTSTMDVVLDDVSIGLTVDDELECELDLGSTDDLLESWPSKSNVDVFVEQVSRSSVAANLLEGKPSEEIDVVTVGTILNASPTVEFGKLSVEREKVKEVADDSEVCAVTDYKKPVFPVDISTSYEKETPLVGGCRVNGDVASPSEGARASFQRSVGVGGVARPYARSVDLPSDTELLSVSDRTGRSVDRNVSLSSTDLQSAKTIVEEEEDKLVVVESIGSLSGDPHAYKPYYFNDGSKRRSISLDETDSSKHNKNETDNNNSKLFKPERSKIFLPLSLCSKSRGGLESQLSPILSKSTEVLSPVARAVSDVLTVGLSKSQDDLSPVTFRFKSFPTGGDDRSPRSPGGGGGEGARATAGAKSQRYSWACYENDKIFASGDAKVSSPTSRKNRSSESPSFRPPYGENTRSSDGYGTATSGEWTFEMTKTALKMKRIFSPLTTTPDEASSPLHPSYVFPTPVAVSDDGEPRRTDVEPCDRKPSSQAAGDALTDYTLPDDPNTYSRLDAFNPKEYSSQASFDKVSFDPSATRYSPYKFPKTDLETLGLDVASKRVDVETNLSPVTSDHPTSYRSSTTKPSTLEHDVTSPRQQVPTSFPAFPRSPMKSPTKTFDPFPTRCSVRTKPKEIAVKLGLYANSSTSAGENKGKVETDNS